MKMYGRNDLENALKANDGVNMANITLCSLMGTDHRSEYSWAHNVDIFSELVAFAWNVYGLDLVEGSWKVGTFEYIYYMYKASTMSDYRVEPK